MVRGAEQLASGPREALARSRLVLERRFGPRLREIVLFGSHARGEATEESDVDVLVVVDGLTPTEKLESLELIHRASIDADGEWCPIIPMVLSAADADRLRHRERLLMHEIDRDGVRL